MNSCSICMKDDLLNKDIYITDCDHLFCNKCLDDWFQRGNKSCPLCRSNINTYKHENDNYKLVIYERNNVNRENIESSLLTTNTHRMYIQNIRLKVYSLFSFIFFIVFFCNYLSFINDYRDLEIDYELCSDNITKLENQLANIYPSVPGTYISIYDGINREDCFHPGHFFGCFSV